MANKSTRLPGTEFESTGNRARSVASGSPGSPGLNRSIATDIGAGALVAMEALQKVNAERDAVTSVKAESAYVLEREKKMAELDPMATDYTERVKQIWGDGKDAIAAAGLTTPAAQADLERRLARHGASAEIIGIKLRKDAVSREGLLTAKDSMDAVGAKIRNDPANANAYLSEFQGGMERLKGVMDPNQMREFARTSADKLAADQVIGYAEKGNFSAARNALQSQASHLGTEKAIALSKYIDDRQTKVRIDGDRAQAASANLLTARMYDWAHGLGPPVSREEIDAKFKGTQQYASMVSVFGSATEKLKNQNDREFDKIMADHAVDISARISDAQAGKGPMPSREEIDALKTWRQYDDLVKQHNATDIAQRRIRVKTEEAVEAVRTGTAKDQEQVDLGIKALIGDVPIGKIAIDGTPEQRAVAIQAMAKIGATTGMLYGDFKNLLENSDSTTDKSRAGQVAFAAEAADDLENMAPRALDNAKLNPTGTLAIVRSEAKRMIEQGMPKSEAYKQAASTYMSKGPLTLAEENDRKDALRKSLAKIDLGSKVEAAMTSWGERNVPFVKLPGQDVALQGEWKRAYETAFMRTGSAEQAEALAKTTLNQIYGTTMVGAVGKPPDTNVDVLLALVNPGMDPAGRRWQIARRPIERYSPPSMRALPQKDQARIYQNQIEPGLKTAGVNLVKDPKFPHLSSYRLVADNQTEQDLREPRRVIDPQTKQVRLEKGLPTYKVQVLRVGGDGEYYDVPGFPRYRPPTEAEVLQDPTYIEINNARLMNDMKARQQNLTNQTEIRTRTERTGQTAPRPSQMPQPLIEPRGTK
jgi:hypothetical protein